MPELRRVSLLPRTTLLCDREIVLRFSGVTHPPIWSAEHLTGDLLTAAILLPRVNSFAEDPRLPPADASRLADYHRSGFDRGHMAPSGDMPDPEAQAESFLLSNMVPQTAALNRGV